MTFCFGFCKEVTPISSHICIESIYIYISGQPRDVFVFLCVFWLIYSRTVYMFPPRTTASTVCHGMVSLHQNNGPLEVTFPESLQTLTLGHHFNRDLSDVHFPSHLRSLTLGQRFTWSLHHVNLPNSLCNLFCQNLLVSCD